MVRHRLIRQAHSHGATHNGRPGGRLCTTRTDALLDTQYSKDCDGLPLLIWLREGERRRGRRVDGDETPTCMTSKPFRRADERCRRRTRQSK
eukprot:scaffold245179_cov33-Tisochrysis_lutea.AAC.1